MNTCYCYTYYCFQNLIVFGAFEVLLLIIDHQWNIELKLYAAELALHHNGLVTSFVLLIGGMH